MENPQFAAREELEECYSELPVPTDGLESVTPKTTSIQESNQEEPELKGWKAIQRTRRRRKYGSNDGSIPHADNSCIHHWIIAEPNGPTSEAVCRKCEGHKEFKNSSESDNVTFSERLL